MKIPDDYQKYISRQELIDGKELLVLDGMFQTEEIEKCYRTLRSLPYNLNDYDSVATSYSLHWKSEFEVSDVPKIMFWERIIRTTSDIFGVGKYTLQRVHSNLHLYGDLQFPHMDSKDGITVVYYANNVWNEKWMGETVFYSDENEPLHLVAPKPGRLVLFKGNIIHRAGVATRECFEPRVTLAFKFSLASL